MANRIITLELDVEEFRWLKNRVAEKMEFYSKCATNKLRPLTGDCYEECPDVEAP